MTDRYYVQLTVDGFAVIDTLGDILEPVTLEHARYRADETCDRLNREDRQASEPAPTLF